MYVPQAIFTSLRGKRLDGYQLAARSPEIDEGLARELNAWGPAHDSLLEPHEGAESINFHPLANGAWHCLSRTVVAGAEYSNRAGGRVYTQMFLLSPQALARFGNNPFHVLRALRAAGRIMVHDEIPDRLRALLLVGRSPGSELADAPEPEQATDLIALEKAVRASGAVALVGTQSAEPWFTALFRRLPAEVRLGVSFSTGLKPSSVRPFKLCLAPSDASQQRQLHRQAGITLVPVHDPPPKSAVARDVQ